MPAESTDPAELIAAITHDMKGPVRIAREHSKALLDNGPLTTDQRRSLEAIERQAEKLKGLIDELERGAYSKKEIPVAKNFTGEMPTVVASPDEAPRILIADDDEDILRLLHELLAERYSVTTASDGGAALEHLRKEHFQLVIVDVRLPVLDGFQLAERLQEESASMIPPAFMYLSGQSSPEAKVRGLSLGASDYVTKPFDTDELMARIARILAAVTREESLRVDALTDPMTGLANYRSFTASLDRELERSKRYDQPLCLLTVDLDHLKRINDTGGHEAGNEAIRLVAQVLKDGVRSFEVVARQGGDEFGVLLPNTSEEEAMRLAERLAAGIAQHSLLGQPLSISVGIAARARGQEMTMRQLIERSDEALYRAKRAGRSRISGSGSMRPVSIPPPNRERG